jgi:hypothetical protein
MVLGLILGGYISYIILKIFIFNPLFFVVSKNLKGEPLWITSEYKQKMEKQNGTRGNDPLPVPEGYEMKEVL